MPEAAGSGLLGPGDRNRCHAYSILQHQNWIIMISKSFSDVPDERIVDYISVGDGADGDDPVIDSVASATDLWTLANMDGCYGEETFDGIECDIHGDLTLIYTAVRDSYSLSSI